MIQAAGLGVAYHAKPKVAAAAPRASITAISRRCFMLQGYRRDEFVSDQTDARRRDRQCDGH